MPAQQPRQARCAESVLAALSVCQDYLPLATNRVEVTVANEVEHVPWATARQHRALQIPRRLTIQPGQVHETLGPQISQRVGDCLALGLDVERCQVRWAGDHAENTQRWLDCQRRSGCLKRLNVADDWRGADQADELALPAVIEELPRQRRQLWILDPQHQAQALALLVRPQAAGVVAAADVATEESVEQRASKVFDRLLADASRAKRCGGAQHRVFEREELVVERRRPEWKAHVGARCPAGGGALNGDLILSPLTIQNLEHKIEIVHAGPPLTRPPNRPALRAAHDHCTPGGSPVKPAPRKQDD